MLTSTIYDVKIRYSVDKAGPAAVRGVTDEVTRLGRESNRTEGMLRRMGAAVMAWFGARAAGKALIGFNATVEDTRQQIAGMLALTKKTDLQDQLSNADRLFANLQKRAAKLPGTTQEYATMAGMLTQPITDAGLGMKDLEDLTVSTVVGAKALRVEAGAAARDVDQALRGQFHSTDVFTGKILGSVGFKGEEGRSKYNALPADQRAETLRDALMQKQLIQLAAAQGDTFNGALSTLQDTVQQFFGKVGLPLFKAITAEIKTWNTWLDKNSGIVEGWAGKIGHGLLEGFNVMKEAVSFLVSHADLLLTIGKVWAGVKIGGMIGNFANPGGKGGMGSALGALGSFKSWRSKARDEFDPETGDYKFTGAGAGQRGATLSSIPLLGQVAGAGYALGSAFNSATGASSALASWFSDLTGRIGISEAGFKKLDRSVDALDDHIRRAAGGEGFAGTQQAANTAGLIADQLSRENAIRDFIRAKASGDFVDMLAKSANLRSMGLDAGDATSANADRFGARALGLRTKQTEEGVIAGEQFTVAFAQLTEYQKRTLDVGKAQQDLLEYLNQQVTAHSPWDPTRILEILRGDTEDPSGAHKGGIAAKPNVNITIQRIEVQSDDPDRFAFGLVDAFRDAAKNPSQAIDAIREG